ncbi:MAG: hypothetical protein J6M38_06290, partial [Lentisphaeria bacterium]|nr:hypothetical protein [Lentisphaeria bacterium]
MKQENNFSGLQCLQILFSQYRRNVNFSALITVELQQKYLENQGEVLLALSNEQQLRAELLTDAEVLKTYAGPVLVRLKNDAWVLMANSRQFVSSETVTIIDPAVGSKQKTIAVPKSQLEERMSGAMIIFRNLAQVDAARHSRLFCLAAIAKHNNTQMDLRRVMHEYAVGEEEVRDSLFRQIASDYEFKTKRLRLTWEKLEKGQSIFPVIAEKNNGKYAVFCGFRKNGEQEEAVLLDPESENHDAPNHFTFLAREQFESDYTGSFILLKKTYRLSDESQPFSLRWFIPEFIKNKGIFGEIALMVAMLTVFSLIVPLFFQIVVDKVLVNQAYNTLNVLGIGILLAVLFNGLVNYVRSYLLLFATNKIDISTATKTFTHLMRLPVDFFERVPSGVLLKHMQQTEKIRGFLSGNLFFTILDVFALCIFIPFLLLYSVQLTLVVLGFSFLMALVIASLIKPFQRRLDELYQAEGKRQSMLVESIHGVKTVKSLALEPVEKKIWDDSTAYAIKSYFRVGKIS